MALCIATVAIPAYAASIIDGDFNAWSFGATGTATVSRESAGGNPGARLNITTVSGPTVWGTAMFTCLNLKMAAGMSSRIHQIIGRQ